MSSFRIAAFCCVGFVLITLPGCSIPESLGGTPPDLVGWVIFFLILIILLGSVAGAGMVLWGVLDDLGLFVYLGRKKRQQQRAKLEVLLKQAVADYRDKELNWCKSLCEYNVVILDSNVWMNQDLDSLFETLRSSFKKTGNVLDMFSWQYDEICNVKKKSEYGSESSSGSRTALSRIERLQSENVLHIPDITVDSNTKPYADPLIIDAVVDAARNGQSVAVITDDVELRIRLKESLKNQNATDWRVEAAEPVGRDSILESHLKIFIEVFGCENPILVSVDHVMCGLWGGHPSLHKDGDNGVIRWWREYLASSCRCETSD